MNIKPFGHVDESALAAFEQEIGSRLPDDYRQFLLSSNGGSFPASGFYVPELDIDCRLDVLFGFNLPPALSLNSWKEEMDEELPPGTMIIGSDARSGLLLLGWEELPGIFYYDHSHRFPSSSEEHNTYFVAYSWTEFISALLEGEAPAETPLSGNISPLERLTLAQVPDESRPGIFQLVDRLTVARFTHQEAAVYNPPA